MADRPAPPLFPLFLRLAGRRVLVVGGGAVGAAKAEALRASAAEVVVVAPVVDARLKAGGFMVHERAFRESDLDGAWLVVAAAPPGVNAEVARRAEARRLFVNVVDDVEKATAYLGGVVRRGGVTLAVSTEGAAPALAGLVREALQALLPDDLRLWLTVGRRERARWRRERRPHAEVRPLLLEALNRIYARRGRASARKEAAS